MKLDKMIYIAGKMSGLSYEEMSSWRIETTKKLKRLAETRGVCCSVINPAEFYNYHNNVHKTEREIMQFELNLVRKSDVVIVNLKDVNQSIGTCIEVYEAFINDIPVIAFGASEEYEVTHPWIKECISRYEETMNAACLYIADFYFW